MAGTVYKSKGEIPTIDVALVTIETTEREFGFETANSIEVEHHAYRKPDHAY